MRRCGRALRPMSPKVGDHTPRIAPLEISKFTISATLSGDVRAKEKDRVIHLDFGVPGGAPTETMIVWFPDANCEGVVDSAKCGVIHRTRRAFERACGRAVTAWHDLEGAAVLAGAMFFDEIHGQRGVELHPVLGVPVAMCTRR